MNKLLTPRYNEEEATWEIIPLDTGKKRMTLISRTPYSADIEISATSVCELSFEYAETKGGVGRIMARAQVPVKAWAPATTAGCCCESKDSDEVSVVTVHTVITLPSIAVKAIKSPDPDVVNKTSRAAAVAALAGLGITATTLGNPKGDARTYQDILTMLPVSIKNGSFDGVSNPYVYDANNMAQFDAIEAVAAEIVATVLGVN